jgi:hypothetical protein
LSIDRVDVAEVELISRYGQLLPRLSTIGGAQDRRACATRSLTALTPRKRTSTPLFCISHCGVLNIVKRKRINMSNPEESCEILLEQIGYNTPHNLQRLHSQPLLRRQA